MDQWDNIQFQYSTSGLQPEKAPKSLKSPQNKTVSVPNRAIQQTSLKKPRKAAVEDITINVGVIRG